MPRKNGQFSRRKPWPYDAYFGRVPVLLKPDAMGNLTSQKSRTLDQSSPSDFEYGSMDPMKERTFLWTQLYGGFGQSVAPSRKRVRRCKYAENADTSINGLWMKGPNFAEHAETIHAGAGEVRQFVFALHGSDNVLWAICQNGVFRRTGDGTWVASLTIGLGGTALSAGKFPQQAVRFKARHAANVDALYVATATGNIYQYNGSAWTEPVAAEGPGTGVTQGECRFIEKVGDELWAAGDYWVTKAEADPLLRASWSGVIYIGDQTSKITWMKQIDNTLVIFKEDGMYTLSTTGVDQELFPHFRLRKSASNGRNATVWHDRMWVSFGEQTFTFTAEGVLTPDGIEQMLDNDTPIQGRFVAGAGHNTWFMYEIYYDNSGNSYLLKHGTWIDDPNEDSLQPAQFVDSHHGYLASWNKRATSAEIVSGLHVSGNDRLYVGFSDGTIQWCVLPRNSPNPAQDGNCEFTQSDSYVYLPVHHSNFQADNKLYRGISALGPTLTNTEWVEVEYRSDINNPVADWVVLNEDQPRFTLPGQRLDFPTSPPVYSKNILFRVKLMKDADELASPLSLTPIIEGITVHEQVRPSVSMEYTFTVLASSFNAKYNGVIDRRRGVTVRDELRGALASPGTVEIMLPDGTVEEMTIIDYREVLIPKQGRRDLEYEILIQATQLQTVTPGTSFSGLTYATLEQYNYGQLESLL